MKAIRTNFDEMWEKYFDSYPGWLYVFDRIYPSYKRPELHPEPGEPSDRPDEFKCSFFLSDPEDTSSDKFYPVDKYNGYIIDNDRSDISSNGEEPENPDTNTNLGIRQEKVSDTNDTEVKNDSGEASDELSYDENDYTSEESRNAGNKSAIQANEAGPVKIVRCKPFVRQPDNIIFECDTGLGFAFVTKEEESLIYTPHKTSIPKTLATISIDTTCLKNPKIKVLFSCNVFFKPRTGQGTAQLEFILSRSCNNGAESHLGNWIFNLEDKSGQISQTFRLSCCNNNSYPGFYNYFIRVIPVYIRNCSVLITNCHMDAFAQSR